MGMQEIDPNLTDEAPIRASDLPPAAPKTALSAREALEKLQRGEPLRDVRVERLTFRGEFPHGVELHNVTLVQPRFEKAVFRGPAAFLRCTLLRPRFAQHTVFEQGLNLAGSELSHAGFNGVTVRGSLRCDNLETRGLLKVIHCTFEGPVRLWDADFKGWVDFADCTFQAPCDFRNFTAEQGFVLGRCRFAGDVQLRGSSIGKKCEFNGSRFEGMLDFSKAKLHDYVYLEGIEQGEKQRFAFANALGEQVLVRPEQLAGRLASEEAGDYERAMHEYAFLKRSYGNLHRHEAEDWAYYRFKVNQRRCCNRSWLRPWTKLAQFGDWLFLDQGCGYCTNPWRAVRAALVAMLLFALLYAVGIEYLQLDKTPFPDQPVTSPANRGLLGLLTSVSVFTTGLGEIQLARGWMVVPLILESLLGTLLWGLFIVAFSRKVIR